MAILETTGHRLEVGDRVRMNISVLQDSDRDGVEFTADGTNYWRYICQHPDEVYTIVGMDFDYETCPYILSGAMAGNTWASDELILVPEPTTNFEVIKNMTEEEMGEQLLPMLLALCEEGVPSPETFKEWLSARLEMFSTSPVSEPDLAAALGVKAGEKFYVVMGAVRTAVFHVNEAGSLVCDDMDGVMENDILDHAIHHHDCIIHCP